MVFSCPALKALHCLSAAMLWLALGFGSEAGLFEPPSTAVDDPHQEQHHRYLHQHAHKSRQGCPRVQPEQADRHRYR